MDYQQRFNRMSFSNMNINTLLSFTELHPRVQTHLQRVYTTLAAAVAVSAVGVYAHILFNLGGMLTSLASAAVLVWLAMTPSTAKNLNTRYGILGGFAFLQGCSIGPLMQLALTVNPGVVLTAALGTTTVFASFSLAALLSPRRSYLFLGGFLSTATLGLLVLRTCGWLVGAAALAFQAELYVGLLLMSLYVIFDTQIIVERASAGNMDHVSHALDLFVDFIAILVRLVIILLKNQEKKEERRRRKERRD